MGMSVKWNSRQGRVCIFSVEERESTTSSAEARALVGDGFGKM